MWNWWRNRQKTLSESDSTRLRRLETRVNEIDDDVSKTFDLVERINARLRQRARRAASDDASGSDDAAADNRDGDERGQSRFPHLESPQPATGNGPGIGPPKFTKDQLRALARQKGINA